MTPPRKRRAQSTTTPASSSPPAPTPVSPPQAGSPFHAPFEIDIVSALAEQLVTALSQLTPAPLVTANIQTLEREQGVYALYQGGTLVYIGKATDLPARLTDHRDKINGRHNIALADMTFAALYVHKNWTALAPETSLIQHFKAHDTGLCEWNGIGFGPHDPGRDRETTNKPPDGFDSRYPIVDSLPCTWIKAGARPALDLLLALKQHLPYLLRYELEVMPGRKKGSFRSGHSGYNSATINVPRDDMSARDILKLVADTIGWQATVFPSHMILYNERCSYRFGQVL